MTQLWRAGHATSTTSSGACIHVTRAAGANCATTARGTIFERSLLRDASTPA
jgi:hypothetical protein